MNSFFPLLDKAPKILKEKVNDLLKICFTNEPNKHLRLQSLNGFQCLLKFEGLIEDSILFDKTCSNNFEAISKTLWHSLWNSNNSCSMEER